MNLSPNPMPNKEPRKPVTQEDKVVDVLYRMAEALSRGEVYKPPQSHDRRFTMSMDSDKAIILHADIKVAVKWLESGEKDKADYRQMYSGLLDESIRIRSANMLLRQQKLASMIDLEEYDKKMKGVLEKVKEIEGDDSHKILADAKRLANYLWETHYKKEVPDWKVLDNTYGILHQIDNMVSGLVRKPKDEKESK